MSEFVRIIDPAGRTIRNDLYNSPPDAASYIIFKDGGLVKAKNGRTGQIEFSGDDAATVIQQAIDALPVHGGKIFIKRGNYKINTQINIATDHVHIEGESIGWGTEGSGSAYSATTLYTEDDIGYILNFTGMWGSIARLNLRGGHKSGGVSFNTESFVTECFITQCTTGINSGSHSRIYDNLIEYCENGIYLNWWETIIDNTFGHNTVGSLVHGGGRVVIVGNTDEKSASFYLAWPTELKYVISIGNILLEHTDSIYKLHGHTTDQVYIIGDIVDGGGVTPHYIETHAGRTILDVVVAHCSVKNLTGAVFLEQAEGTIKKHHVSGFVAEGSGTATIPAGSTSVTVSHGLATTPTKVLVTPIGDPGDRFWVANVTSTSFDIVVATAPAADIDFYWQAEV